MQAPDAAPAAPADPSGVEQATADVSAATVDTPSVAAAADTPDVATEASPEVRAETDTNLAPAPGCIIAFSRAARRPSPAATLTPATDLVAQPSGASPFPVPSPAPEASEAAAPPSPAPASPAPASTPAVDATPPPEPPLSPPRVPAPPAEPTVPVASLVGGALANIVKAADAGPEPAVPSPAPAASPPAAPSAPAPSAVVASTPAPVAAAPPTPAPAPAISPAKVPSPPPSPPKSPSSASALDTGAAVPRSRPATPPSPSARVAQPPSPKPPPASPPAGSPSQSRPTTPPKFPRPMTPPEKEKKGAGFFSRMFAGGKSKANAANKAGPNSPAEPSASSAPTAPVMAPVTAPVVAPSTAETTAPASAVGHSSTAAALQAAGFGSPVTTFPPADSAAAAEGSASATGDTPEVPTAQPTPSASAVVATEPSTVPAPVPAPAPESAPPEEEPAATATATAAAELAPPASPYHPPAAPADASDSAAAALVEPSSSSAVTDASLASPQRPAPSSLTPQKAATIKSDIVGMLSQRTGLGLNVKSPPRALSKEDALSVRVHSSSPLVPSSVLVSPVLRMHLVDSELGSPINPSGEPTTPLQTAPFDLSRRLKSAYAAEWEETLDVEEELGGLLSNRAVLLFELLQPPPSFQFYDERPDVFPGGRPARVAWGFLNPAHQGPEAQLRAIAGAAVQVGGEGVERARGAHSRPVVGRNARISRRRRRRLDAPGVFVAYKSAIKTSAALRALYPRTST